MGCKQEIHTHHIGDSEVQADEEEHSWIWEQSRKQSSESRNWFNDLRPWSGAALCDVKGSGAEGGITERTISGPFSWPGSGSPEFRTKASLTMT